MTDNHLVPLSEEIQEIVRTQYAPEDQADVCAALLEYGADRWQSAGDRVRFDVLYLAAGDSARVRQLLNIAKRDYRNVVMQEYFWRAGRSYPHEWARRHDINRDYPVAPEANPNAIAVASVARQMQKRRGILGLVAKVLHKIVQRPSALLLARQSRALCLAFNTRDELEKFARMILTLSEDKKKLDLSPILEYPWDLKAPRTILRRLHGEKEARFKYAFGVISWKGNSEYWRTSSRRLMELAQSEVANKLLMMKDSTDGQVIIGYQMPERWAKTAWSISVLLATGKWPSS